MTLAPAAEVAAEPARPKRKGQPQRRIVRREVDGVLLLDKPQGMSSNGALQTARRLLAAAKAGHTGTLDPMASGLLPLTFGEATKFSQMLLDADKTYEAVVRLGVDTDSGDAEGKVLATRPVAVDRAALEAVLERFRGEIEQVPPMYSALKRDGKALYEYARAGIELERAARRVVIHALELLDFAGERFTIRVHCSKGTYIRSLAMDIGAALGCGAHLAALRRTAIGAFDLSGALTLEALEAAGEGGRDALLAPVDALVAARSQSDRQALELLTTGGTTSTAYAYSDGGM
uniref:tRNA pseudouridine(55) synthase TruB n=1 Tax=Thauera aminoaromatica TaxID=164330 RepID=UPI0035ADC3C5